MENFAQKIRYLKVSGIRNLRPRQAIDPEELRDLTDSVALYGVLQPLSVRAEGNGWVLLDGEKRLRAAKRVGMETVPCFVEDTAARELLQKLRRKDLHYITAAQLTAQLMEQQHLSQQQAAKLLGQSQSTVANSLRILKHPPRVLEALLESGLSQRHARALLSVPEECRCRLVHRAAQEGWSVSRLEHMLERDEKASPLAAVEGLARSLGLSGRRQETETEVVLTIRMPKMA